MNLWTLLTILFIASADVRVVGQECQRSETRLTYNTEAGCASGTQTHDFCSPGKKIANRCEGECTYCGTGEYQNEYTDCSTCLKCTTEEDCCEGQEILTNCSSDRNAVCGCPPCTTITCPPSITPDLPVEPSFQQNCPSDITIEAEEGATGGAVTWTEPVVSNASAAVQSHYPGDTFRIGYTDVFYAFSGSTGNMITCSFVINVKEAPRTTSTVDPVSTTTDQPEISSRCMNPVPNTTEQPDSGQFSSCDGQTVCWVLLGIITVVLVLFICGVLILYKCHRDKREQQICDAELLQGPDRDEGDGGAPPQPQQANDNGDTLRCPLLEGNGATVPANPQGANVYGDTPLCPLLEGNGATAPANPQGANEIQMTSMVASQSGDESATYVNTPRPSNIGPSVVLPTDESDQGPSSIQGSEGGDPTPGSQLQFSNAAIGNVLITEEEINDVADEVYKHFGTKIKSLDRFFSKLGIPFQDYKRMLEDTTSTGINDKLFDVIMRWHGEAPQTKEAIRKGLYKNHEQLGIWYVGYVNNGPVTDQQ